MKYNNIIMEISKNEYISLKNDAKNIKQKVDTELKANKKKRNMANNIKKKNSINTKKELEAAIQLLHSFYLENVKSNEKNIGSFLDTLKFSLLLYKNIQKSNTNIFKLVDEKRILENKLYKYSKPHMSVFSTKQEFIEFKSKKDDILEKLNVVDKEIEKIIQTLGSEMFNTYSTFIQNGDIVDFKTNIVRLSYIVNSLKNKDFNLEYNKVLEDEYFRGEYDKIIQGLNPKFDLDKIKNSRDIDKISIILNELFDEKNNILSVIGVVIFAKIFYDLKLRDDYKNINADNLKVLNKEIQKIFHELQSKTSNSGTYTDLISMLENVNIENFKHQSSYLESNINNDIVTLKLKKEQFIDILKMLEFFNNVKNTEDIEKISTLSILNGLQNIEKGNSKDDVKNLNSLMFVSKNGLYDDISKRYDFISNLKINLNESNIEAVDNILKIIYKQDNSEELLELFNQILYIKGDSLKSTIQIQSQIVFGEETKLNIEELRTFKIIRQIKKSIFKHSKIIKLLNTVLRYQSIIHDKYDKINLPMDDIMIYFVLFEISLKYRENNLELAKGDNYIQVKNLLDDSNNIMNAFDDAIYELLKDEVDGGNNVQN